MPEQDREISAETTLIENYLSIKDFAADYKLKARLGWKVVKVIAPEEPRPPGLPICLLRRFSKRYRYHVIFVRQRF